MEQVTKDIQTGVICKLVYGKFYGFIQTPEKGLGIFFHGSTMADGNSFDSLREGQPVQFKTQLHTVKGTLQAYDVEAVQDQELLTTKTGTVSNLVQSKRLGYILPDDGTPLLFFHWTGVVDPLGFDGLREGDQVAYLLIADQKARLKAVGVVRE